MATAAQPRNRPSDPGVWQADAVDLSCAPDPDGDPDPGEIVWTWVPYEDDPTQGKDRPVLLVGRDDQRVYPLMTTSEDHDRDAEQEARAGRYWFDIGSGPWDHEGRTSEVRLNRLIEVDPESVRREGAVLDEDRFTEVVRALAPFRR